MAASTTPSSPSAASESAPPAAAVEVYVGNIPFKTNETQLEELFKPFGQVAHSKIIRRRGRSLGYGFVGFVLQTDAEKAVAALHNSQYEERPITVEIATSVASSPPSSSSSTSVSSSTSSSSSSPPPSSSSSSRSSRDVHNETFVALAQFFEWYEQVWQPQEGGTKYQVSEDTMYTLLFHKFFLHLGYVLPSAAAERGLREFNGASEKKLVSIFRLLSRTELVRQVRQHIKGNQQRNILALVSSLGARQLLYIETINDVKQVFFPDLKRLNAFSIEFGLFCHHFYAFLQLFHNLFYHKHPRTPYINKLPLLPVDLSPDSSSSSSSSAPAATTPRASSSDPPAASPSTANNEPTTSSTPGENSTTAVDEHGHHHHPHHRHHHGHGHAHGHGHGHGHHHHHQHNADHHARRATSPAKTSPTLPSKASIPRHNPAGRIYQQPQRRH